MFLNDVGKNINRKNCPEGGKKASSKLTDRCMRMLGHRISVNRGTVRRRNVLSLSRLADASLTKYFVKTVRCTPCGFYVR